MNKPQPTDYLGAAVLYLVVDGQIDTQGLTASSVAKIISAKFGFDVHTSLANTILTDLDGLGLFIRTDDSFGDTYFRPAPSFREAVAQFRLIDGSHPTAIVLDRYMNGPADWMANALSSDQFKRALDEQLLSEGNGESATNDARNSIQHAIVSADWTGFPRSGTLTSEASAKVLAAVNAAEKQLTASHVSNELKAQMHAYLIAIRALAEAPDPPADLIWMLISRAADITQLAMLVVALVSLFS